MIKFLSAFMYRRASALPDQAMKKKELHIDRKYFKITSLRKEEDDLFWKRKTHHHHERIAGLEELRRIIFGYDLSTERLQRILTSAPLKED